MQVSENLTVTIAAIVIRILFHCVHLLNVCMSSGIDLLLKIDLRLNLYPRVIVNHYHHHFHHNQSVCSCRFLSFYHFLVAYVSLSACLSSSIFACLSTRLSVYLWLSAVSQWSSLKSPTEVSQLQLLFSCFRLQQERGVNRFGQTKALPPATNDSRHDVCSNHQR